MKSTVIRIALGLSSITAISAAQQSSEPLKIGNHVQLFVDDYLVESMHDVQLELQKPQPAGVAIRFDKPWEGNTSAYFTVFHDGNKFRLYYRGASEPSYVRASALKPGETVPPIHRALTCYAESADGITWTKPALGLVDFNGSRDNNIVLDDPEASNNFSPFIDTNPKAPASERYKAIGGDSPKGLFLFTSPDAIHWKKMTEKRALTDGYLDSLNVAFWDPLLEEYVAIYRAYVMGIRTIKRATSKDFLQWNPGEIADYGDAPLEQLYTNATTPYFRSPQIYLAFPKRYVPWNHASPDDPRHDGVSEAVFMSSRDGVHWDRRFMEAFIRPGRDPLDWVHRDHMIATGILQTAPDEISIFAERHYTFPSAYLERVTLRLDGFASVHAGYHGGTFTTKPLVLDGSKLVLNYATSAVGSIRWEIIDSNGNPLPGLGVEQTQPLSGDEIEHVVQIQNPKHKPASGLESHPLRLRFIMRDADLYSLQIRD